MRLAVTLIASIVALALSGAVGLLVAMWLGSLVSTYEPGAYIGFLLAVLLAPVTAISASSLTAVFVWQTVGRRSRSVA